MDAPNLKNVSEASPLLLAVDSEVFKSEKTLEDKAFHKTATLLSANAKSLKGSESNQGLQSYTITQNWSTGFCDCINFRDEWASMDTEICLLGWLAPCALYSSNREHLSLNGEQYHRDCCTFFSLWAFDTFVFQCNILAPIYSFPVRSQIREKYGLQGFGESCGASLGCSPFTTKEGKQNAEKWFDCLAHILCQPCALCQEARELRRRVPHTPVSTHPLAPPSSQAMNHSTSSVMIK